MKLLFLALAALVLAWLVQRADVCIDDPDHCYPASPISPLAVHQVYLPVVIN